MSSDYYNILLKKPKNSNGNCAVILYHIITKTMQAKLPLHKKLFFRLYPHTISVLLLLVANLSFSNVVAQATFIWTGSGTVTGSNTLLGQSFNNPSNWDLLRVPTSNDNVLIPFTTFGAINLTQNLTVKNLTVFIRYFNINNNNNNNNTAIFNVGANTLTVTGTTLIDVQDDHPQNKIYIGVNDATSAGTIDFMGDVVMGATNLRDGVYIMGNPNSTIICRGNLTLGIKAQVVKGAEPGTLLFDGTGTQQFIFNNVSDNQVSCRFNNVVVGKNNNPTVVLGGTTTPDNIIGNLTVNGSSVLDLNTRQLNRQSDGGNLLLKNTATIRAAALLSAANNGNATLITGSNFPSGFSNIILDSTSTVEFYGTTQAIPGAVQGIKGYGNLTLVNTTKTLSSSFAMFRNLTIAPNTTMALGNFNDTLKSNSQTTAYVSAVPTNAAITYGNGGFVVERYLAAFKSWRLLATPVDIATSLTISQAWREDNSALSSTGFGTQITGPQGPGTPSASAVLDVFTQRGSLKSYNPAVNDFVEVANANTTKIANTAGYYVFVRGDRGVNVTGATGATNLRIKGRIRTGDQDFAVAANKFASIGNPFACRIDFRTVHNSSFSPAYYVWNPNPVGTRYNAGKYQAYINYGDGNYRLGGPDGPIKNFIESGQAVFVQSISGGTITIKESDKFGGSSLVGRGDVENQRQDVKNSTLEIDLLIKDSNGEEILADATVLDFDAAYSSAIDNQDVRKISNASDNLSIKNGFTNLVLDRRASLKVTDTIFLNLANTSVGNYKLHFDPSVLSNLTLQGFIKDKFRDTLVAVSFKTTTGYAFATTTDAASRASDRFMIVFKTIPPASFTAIKAEREENNNVTVSWNMANENNIATYEIERSLDSINFKPIHTHSSVGNNRSDTAYTYTDAAAPKAKVWYRIKANAFINPTQLSKNAMVEAAASTNNIGISVYPNPIVNGTVNLYLTNKPAGNYTVTIVNNMGQIIKTAAANVQLHTAQLNIQLQDAPSGLYQVMVKDVKGNTLSTAFIKP